MRGLLPFLGAMVILASGCSKPEDGATAPLRIGMELNYPPFEMTDAQGKPAGVSVDLAEALGKFLNRKVVIENYPFDGLIPALKTGRIDMAISSMTITEERRKSVDFSDPYLTTGMAILVGKDSPIREIGDVNRPGRKIAVKVGTTGHTYALEHLKEAEVLVFNEDAACALEVAQGKADAFIYDQMSIFQHWQKNRETTRPILRPFKTESWGIAIAKGNDALRGEVNRFLAAFKADGSFEHLGDKYISAEDRKAFGEMGYPFAP